MLLVMNCSRIYLSKTNIIRISGSDTMLILLSRLAEQYMKDNPNVSVYVEGGGTVNGINRLIKGDVEICAASRPLKPNEARLLANKYGKLGVSILVAKDALSIFINPQNPIHNLNLTQLKNIFSGKVTNWKEIGETDKSILVFIRPPNSGTHLYFKEHVLEGEGYSPTAKVLPSTADIIQSVLENTNAIGYGGIAYGSQVVHCNINNVAPTEENVRNDTYPIIRYLYFYTVDTPEGRVKSFIDWVLKDGQKIVKEVGYISLWEEK